MEEIITWITANPEKSFYALMALSFLVNRLPYIGVFFRTLNTLLHESGHAIGAIATSGEVLRIDLNKDTSGIAQTKSKGRFSAFITSFSGYPFAALASSLFLILTLNGYQKEVAFVILSLALLNLILFVRNVYGIFWLIVFALLLGTVAVYGSSTILWVFVLFISLIALTETFMSTLLITYLGLTNPRKAGDMTNLQKSTGIPAGVWALLNGATVAFVLYYTVANYFPDILHLTG